MSAIQISDYWPSFSQDFENWFLSDQGPRTWSESFSTEGEGFSPIDIAMPDGLSSTGYTRQDTPIMGNAWGVFRRGAPQQYQTGMKYDYTIDNPQNYLDYINAVGARNGDNSDINYWASPFVNTGRKGSDFYNYLMESGQTDKANFLPTYKKYLQNKPDTGGFSLVPQIISSMFNMAIPGSGALVNSIAKGKPTVGLGDILSFGNYAFGGTSPSTTAGNQTGAMMEKDYSGASALGHPGGLSMSAQPWTNIDPGFGNIAPTINYGGTGMASPMGLSDFFSDASMPDLSGFESLVPQSISDFTSDMPGFDFSIPSIGGGDFSGFMDIWNKFKGSPFGKTIFSGQGGSVNPFLKSGVGLGMTLYNAGKAKDAYKQQKSTVDNYARGLQDIFSPNSAYAQNMRQQLERQDAAAGRRSQYGQREAQLAGMLTDRQAQVNQNLASMYSSPQYLQLNNAIADARKAPLAAGLNFLMSDKWNMNDAKNLWDGVQNWF